MFRESLEYDFFKLYDFQDIEWYQNLRWFMYLIRFMNLYTFMKLKIIITPFSYYHEYLSSLYK